MRRLTPTEIDIMKLLWREKRPLSAPEILKLSPERAWRENSLYPTLQHLQEKGAISIVGYIPIGRKYGRIYSPVLTQEAYYCDQLNMEGENPDAVKFLQALLNSGHVDEKTLEELEAMIQDYRKSKIEKP
jgi:predicted transcriptional regulator